MSDEVKRNIPQSDSQIARKSRVMYQHVYSKKRNVSIETVWCTTIHNEPFHFPVEHGTPHTWVAWCSLHLSKAS